MAASANWYANAIPQMAAKNVNITTDTVKMMLLSAAYTPNLVSNIHYSDISANELATAGGYTAGGVTLTSCTLTTTAANSWTVSWAATTAYTFGQVVKPGTPNGFLYKCAAAGTSAGGAPTFPTVVGQTVTDGTVTWVCAGVAISVFTSATAQWAAATFTTSYGVIFDAQSGVGSTEPLLNLQTFSAAQAPSSVTFQVIPDATLGWGYFFS